MTKKGTIKRYAKQHFVAQCYTKPWCDPASFGPKMTPCTWVFETDGSGARRKAPINLFTETDIYTFVGNDGQRDLRLEHGLCELEDKFTRIRNLTFFRGGWPSDEQVAWLLAFISTAHTRTKTFRDFHQKQWGQIRERMEKMELAMADATPEQRRLAAGIGNLGRRDSDPGFRLEDVKRMERNPLQLMLAAALEAELPIMSRMSLAVLHTDDPIGFVTTDNPVMRFDPTAYRRQPIWRAPGLAWQDIEVSLPISPQLCLFLSHRSDFKGYVEISTETLDELNRLRIAHADEHFISRCNVTRAAWFNHPPLPDDAWERVRERKIASGEWPAS